MQWEVSKIEQEPRTQSENKVIGNRASISMDKFQIIASISVVIDTKTYEGKYGNEQE